MSTDVSEEHIASALLAASLLPVSFLSYRSTLKMELICSSKTLMDFHRTTLCYIPEDRKNPL
jgi:hypothetical protein